MINLLRKKFPGDWYYDPCSHAWYDRKYARHVYGCAALAPRYDGDDDTFAMEYWMYSDNPGPTPKWAWSFAQKKSLMAPLRISITVHAAI
jgi:hypothetical protein